MKRPYRFIHRKARELPVVVVKPTSAQLKALTDYFYADMTADGSGLVEVYEDISTFDLLDLLRLELIEAPLSPVSIELKRLIRVRSAEHAQSVAAQILEKDA